MGVVPQSASQAIEGLQAPFSECVRAAAETWIAMLGDRLVSLGLFGSVARQDARESSDIDRLVVADGFPTSLPERRRPLLDAWAKARDARALPWIEWNLVTKSRDEARFHSPLFLDIVEDALEPARTHDVAELLRRDAQPR